nr:NAD-binding protein [Candidatus Sigynarchaeota archaeon]
ILLVETSSLEVAIEFTFLIGEGTTTYDHFYYRYAEFVIYVFVIGLFNLELFRNYHPRKTCERLATKMTGHSIVFGYNSYGARVRSYLEKNNLPCVVVARNEADVEDLIGKEEPVMICDVIDQDFMKHVNMAKAKFVFLCDSNNFINLNFLIETRKVNASCKIVARVLDDHLISIYESYKCFPVSTSMLASTNVFADYITPSIHNLYFIGFNDFTKTFIDMAIKRGIACHCIEKDEGDVKDFADYYTLKNDAERKLLVLIQDDYSNRDVLKSSGIFSADVIIITEDIEDDLIHVVKLLKDVNPAARIIVRCFNDDIAKIFEKLGCITISTSTYELEDEIKPLLGLKK